MRILVTGVSLHGNKGAVALALSVRQRIQERLPQARFVFSVASQGAFHRDLDWAARYGVEAVEAFRLTDLAAPLWILQPRRLARLVGWLRALARSDLALDLSGISYVGPPLAPRHALIRSRLHHQIRRRRSGLISRPEPSTRPLPLRRRMRSAGTAAAPHPGRR